MPLAFALAAGSFRDGTRVAATAPDLVRAMCEANADQVLLVLDRTLQQLNDARDALSAESRRLNSLGSATPHGARYDNFGRPEIVTVVVGDERWREARRRGPCGRCGQIRSANPG